MKLFIETSRDGYTPVQCGRTMTVGQLIDLLSEYDDDTEVFLSNNNGYTYGSINNNSFRDSSGATFKQYIKM